MLLIPDRFPKQIMFMKYSHINLIITAVYLQFYMYVYFLISCIES